MREPTHKRSRGPFFIVFFHSLVYAGYGEGLLHGGLLWGVGAVGQGCTEGGNRHSCHGVFLCLCLCVRACVDIRAVCAFL